MTLFFRSSEQSSTFHIPSVVGPARFTGCTQGQIQADLASLEFLYYPDLLTQYLERVCFICVASTELPNEDSWTNFQLSHNQV